MPMDARNIENLIKEGIPDAVVLTSRMSPFVPR